uniref:SET domain-containing protein n=1 Tax=Cyprinus carpio carpio TaxID=630221 RepID=A0A9J8A5I7_CYPCA
MSKRRTRLSPQAEAIQFILSGREKPCFKVKCISDFKGRGVFTCTPIEKGSFVAEYRGELISRYELDKRQKKYTEKQNAFLFDFEWNNSAWCIDASREDGSLGRLVNDCHKSPNCKMRRLTVQGKPHLCLFAIENIEAETEITYDYGDSQWPWRNLAPSGMIQTQHSGDPEVSERPSSSFQQAPSGMIQTQHSGDPEVSERPSSSFQQANHSTGIACFKHVLTAEQVGPPSVDDGGFHDGNSTSPNDQISNDMTDESSDATDYDDANYVPDSSGNSSDTSSNSRDLKIIDNHLPHKVFKEISLGMATAHSSDSTNSSLEQRSFSSSKMSSGHCSSGIICSDSSSEKTLHSSINVTSLPNTAKRSKYNKKQYCLYCSKAISKLARHLESAHSTQPDVAKALSFNKRSRERKDLLRSLKKRGNFNHNATVASSGDGEMVACRRPTRVRQSNDFSHCKFCQGLYARDCLWRHVRNCPQKSVEVETRVGRKRIHIDLPKAETVHEAVWKIACEMNQDDISLVVRSESDILSLGESMYNGRKPNEKRNDYIRQKMREMARLLIAARATTPLKTTEDLVMPSNFPHVIQAVRSVAGYDLDTNSYKTPSLALKLGHSLAKVAGIVQCNAIIANRNVIAESAKQFATLYEKRWAESISSAALGTLHQAKWNKPHVLPFTQDVHLLHKFLATERAKCMKDLEEDPNIKSFGNLAQVTLTQVVLFNRRRQGEVSKIELQAFTSRNRTELNPDIMTGLTEFERKVAKYFDRVEIRGKRSRMVPVLLTPDMIAAMDLLIKNRNECQVHTENVYLFARPCVLSHYRGSDCFRKYSKQCGAKNPESLTSTRLRKQVATLSTVLNLKENEMDQLATFLGHDIRVHREFYRLPESTLQLAKVSKLDSNGKRKTV